MKNFMLLISLFFRFAFLFVSDRFSAYASQWILKCVGGRSDIIEVLLDCVAYFCLRCCWTAFVLESLAFKAPTKGEKNKTRKMAHWQLTIIDFPLSPRLLLPACCRLLCLPRCEPASARFPFSQHHINEGMRERGNKLYRYKKNSAAFVVRVLCVRYAPINIKHINNQFYCRFLPLPLFTHMALWNISRQFQIFNLYNRYARQAWMNFWAFG